MNLLQMSRSLSAFLSIRGLESSLMRLFYLAWHQNERNSSHSWPHDHTVPFNWTPANDTHHEPTGSSVIRSQERINTEGSQATVMPMTPTRKLEIGCEEFSKSLSEGAERSAEYQNCIASGLSVIKAQERINAEGSQAAIKPIAPVQAPIAPQAEGSTDRPIVTDTASSQADRSN